MATVPQKTLTWLYRVLTNAEHDPNQAYKDPKRTYSDVINLLVQYPGFAPRTDVYTYENGTPALLLHVAGTLPVTFRGSVYRFPITIWVPKAYPREPPMVYVTPTRDMLVRPGQHVSGEGRVYHHYLAHWSEAWDRSTIVDFLYILRDVFAKEPPVISKQQQNMQHMPAQHIATPPAVPPLPRELAQTASPSPPHAQQSQAPPQLPPKPGQAIGPERQRDPSAQEKYNQPPPVPPLPSDARHQRSMSQQRNHEENHDIYHTPQRSSSLRQFTAQSQMASQTPQLPPKQGYPQDGYRPTPVGNISSTHGHNMTAPPQTPQAFSYQHQQQPHQPQRPYAQPQIHVTPHTQHLPPRPVNAPAYGPAPLSHHTRPPHQPAAVEKKTEARDPLNSLFELELPALSTPHVAPPIPPNPEKDALLRALSKTLTQTLQSIISQTNSGLQPLRSQSQALQAAISTLQSEISALNSLHSTLQSNTSILQQSLQRADGIIADAKSRISTNSPSRTSPTAEPSSSRATVAVTERQEASGLPAIDDVLVAPTVVGKQLYDLVADEQGIQRAIYALQAGLVKGRVSVETWARLTRGLAREAFLKRALIRKAAKGMGLAVEGDG
ncbi:hypothetical protein ACJ72_07289 [Emergomyces africanus]|uniref:UEV domain-containing protein n=1 Tax=Emergomyces africanus TaxID=1955775 RepID=A0A1B7NNK9_9EURO|nr:hypothetical protein ACJ72_07289 [Emergomyces africanus]